MFFAPDSVPVGAEFVTIIENAIVDASKDGAVVVLLTPNALRSEWVKREIVFASHEGGRIIPIIVGDTKLDGILMYELARMQAYRLPENPTDAEIDEMIDKIGRDVVKGYTQ